ncbi:MAG: MATE family efflux transporter [Thermoflexaceae bacterium]|nr:MATE family efflux transporter [Thermoflexaceae bacterium]
MNSTKKYEMNMCEGPLAGKIMLFAVPLMLSSILQLLFNAVDTVVVGRYCGSDSLAAVGSTTSLINLLMNVFIGLSVGTNVLVARYYGAGKEKDVNDTVHTAILSSLIGGVILAVIGFIFAKPLLLLMSSPENVIDLSALYLRIYFLGMPVTLLYNFGSAILRAIGDTRRPLYYLITAGVVNVVLNLIFVICLDMGVAGVAVATIVSQALSAVLVTKCLIDMEGPCHLNIRHLVIKKNKFLEMLRYGLPAGIQGTLFSLSNVIIQSSVNSFGSVIMAGNAAAANLEGFVYVAMNAFHHTALSFTSQNYGGGRYDRINKVLGWCLLFVTIVGGSLGVLFYIFAIPLLSIYSNDMQVISYGIVRMSFICVPYFLCGLMDTMVGSLRGLGYSVMPMIVSLLGACVFRIVWINTVFQAQRTLDVLYVSYPISWFATFAIHVICFIIVRRKIGKKNDI